MTRRSIRIARDGRVGEVVLARPDRRNALDYAAVLELLEALGGLEEDPSVGAILVHGEGPSFCSGGDLSEFQEGIVASAYEFHEGGAGWADLMTMIPAMRTPVVAAPHGHALAGGCGIVAAADVVVAAEGTVFATSEIKIGLFPIIIYPTLSKAIGSRAAREMALTGRRVDADEALRLGLVHHIVAVDDHLLAARRLAEDIASFGRHALGLGKWFMGQVDDLPLGPATTFAQAIRGSFMSTPDFAEGVQAFFDGRPPNFHRE